MPTGSKPLIILGFSARAAAECAVQAAYQPIVVDYCGDRDLLALDCEYRSMASPDSLDWLLSQPTNTPILMTGGMEHQVEILGKLSRPRDQSRQSIEPISTMRDIKNWQHWAEDSGLVWPTSVSFQDRKPLTGRPQSEWLIKSSKSVGGQGVRDWPGECEASFQEHQAEPGLYYLQQKLEGPGIGVTFLSSEYGTVPLGVAENAFQDSQGFLPKYMYKGSIGPFALPESHLSKLISFGQRVGEQSKIMGLWQADFILNQGCLALLEINPRWSASMELLDVAFEERLVGWHCDCIEKNFKADAWRELTSRSERRILETPLRVFGKWIQYASRDLVVSQAESLQWWEARWACGQRRATCGTHFVADIPEAGTQVARGQPIRTIMIAGQSKEEVIAIGLGLASSH